jgi:hypothetical protein
MLDPQVLDFLTLDFLALDSLALDFLAIDFLALYQDLPLRMEFPPTITLRRRKQTSSPDNWTCPTSPQVPHQSHPA